MPSRSAILTFVLLSAALWLAACSPKPPAPEPVRAVRVMTVSPDLAGGLREYAAEVRARTESRLGFRVAGKLVARSAEVGHRVRSGQALAQVDPVDLKLQQEAAQAALRAAQAAVDFAAADFKRYEEMRAQGFISATELERRESSLKAQRAQLDQARAQAEVQGNLAAYAVLTAPAAGVITATEAEVGAVLAAGTPVVRVAHDGPRDVVFSVPEDAVVGIRALQGRRGVLRVRPWGGANALPATVREVAAAADPATRTFLVRADIGQAPVQLGQTMTAQLDLPRRDAAARLPLSAIMSQQGQTTVWVLEPASMTVKLQSIVVGEADGNSVMVASGLQPGQRVVTAGVHMLTPGQKVKLFDDALDAAAPAQPAAPAASR